MHPQPTLEHSLLLRGGVFFARERLDGREELHASVRERERRGREVRCTVLAQLEQQRRSARVQDLQELLLSQPRRLGSRLITSELVEPPLLFRHASQRRRRRVAGEVTRNVVVKVVVVVVTSGGSGRSDPR